MIFVIFRYDAYFSSDWLCDIRKCYLIGSLKITQQPRIILLNSLLRQLDWFGWNNDIINLKNDNVQHALELINIIRCTLQLSEKKLAHERSTILSVHWIHNPKIQFMARENSNRYFISECANSRFLEFCLANIWFQGTKSTVL